MERIQMYEATLKIGISVIHLTKYGLFFLTTKIIQEEVKISNGLYTFEILDLCLIGRILILSLPNWLHLI